MQHRNKPLKLGKDRKHRIAALRNLSLNIIKHEKIKTTLAKAKFLKSFLEKIITRSKKDNLHNRRLVHQDIRDTKMLKKLFEDIGKRYQNRNGGYLRIYRLGKRKGDAAELCLVELVEELLTDADKDKDMYSAWDKANKFIQFLLT